MALAERYQVSTTLNGMPLPSDAAGVYQLTATVFNGRPVYSNGTCLLFWTRDLPPGGGDYAGWTIATEVMDVTDTAWFVSPMPAQEEPDLQGTLEGWFGHPDYPQWSVATITTVTLPQVTCTVQAGISTQPLGFVRAQMAVTNFAQVPQCDYWRIEWGDYSDPSLVNPDNPLWEEHVYTQSGSFLIRAIAEDVDAVIVGQSPPVNVVIDLENVPPVINVVVCEEEDGRTYTLLTEGIFDPDGDAVQSASITWGDGSPAEAFLPGDILVHTYDSAYVGQFVPIAIETVDEHGATAYWTYQLTPSGPNRPPAISEIRVRREDGTRTVYAAVSVVDPDGDAISSVTIDWGDGAVTGWVDPDVEYAHDYAHDGVFVIQATAVDEHQYPAPSSPAVLAVVQMPSSESVVTAQRRCWNATGTRCLWSDVTPPPGGADYTQTLPFPGATDLLVLHAVRDAESGGVLDIRTPDGRVLRPLGSLPRVRAASCVVAQCPPQSTVVLHAVDGTHRVWVRALS